MGSSADQIAEHYQLSLTAPWVDWFNQETEQLLLAGPMRLRMTADQLCVAQPQQIWAGFMLPDTLPVLGNDYGDWICVRVDESSRPSELIYWYHGGGDWIPVGNSLAEACLHDAIDQYRQERVQMLRGAGETRAGETRGGDTQVEEARAEEARSAMSHGFGERSQILASLLEPTFHAWLVESLPQPARASDVAAGLQAIHGCLERSDFRGAATILFENHWARVATACDLIEEYLQVPISKIAQQSLAAELGMRWYPDYVSKMFDVEHNEPPLREGIMSVASISEWPRQAWAEAARIAESVLAQRQDLGWATTVAGWNAERQGFRDQAIRLYFDGRMASSFADQSVRMNSHCLSERTGKFSIERLQALAGTGDEWQQDSYLRLYCEPERTSPLANVHRYWWDRGQEFMQLDSPDKAYDCFLRSGWDLGVSRLEEYRTILQALVESATAAGWPARAQVAAAHLRSLMG